MEHLQTSCRNGNAEGCSLLGFLSNKAKHSEQDLRLSKKYYRQMTLYAQKACEKLSESLCVDSRCLNASENCNLAGLGYGNGLGVAKNTSLSARFYEKSCRMGNAEGCLVAGTGDLLTHRLDKAVSALKRACTLGNGMGCLTLAMEYDGPNYGLKKDPAKAGIYYEKSCRISENAFACQRAKELMP
jgi:TPR repeat protein